MKMKMNLNLTRNFKSKCDSKIPIFMIMKNRRMHNLVLRRLPIPFSQFVSIISFLVVTAACLDSDLFLLVNAEKEEQKGYYLLHSISSLLFDNDVPDLYPGTAFVKELENLIKNFEYTFSLDGSQIFLIDDIKQDIISEYKSSNYYIDEAIRV